LPRLVSVLQVKPPVLPCVDKLSLIYFTGSDASLFLMQNCLTCVIALHVSGFSVWRQLATADMATCF